MKRTPKAMREMLTVSVDPIVVPRGFSRHHCSYSHARGSVMWILECVLSRWNARDAIEFTFEACIYIEGVVAQYVDAPLPENPVARDCCVRARVGMLSEQKCDLWWQLGRESSSDDVRRRMIESIQNVIRYSVFPFFARFETPEAVAAFLVGPRAGPDRFVMPQARPVSLAYAAIIYHGLGQRDLGDRVLSEAIIASSGTPVESVVNRLRNRFGGSAMS